MVGSYPYLKRLLDLVLSFSSLLVLSPFLAFISLLIRLESPGSPFFLQERIGKGMVPFRLVKFRTMTARAGALRGMFTPGDRSRVTRLGRVLRKTKIDELPELFNVLKGDMAIVGPRPEVAKYVSAYPGDFELIFELRPGLSDSASIKYRNEEAILAGQKDPEDYYLRVILPEKLRLARSYVENVSFRTDMGVVKETLKTLLGLNSTSVKET